MIENSLTKPLREDWLSHPNNPQMSTTATAPPAPTKEKVQIKSIAPALDQNQQPKSWTSSKQIKYNIQLVTLEDGRVGEWMDNGKNELVAGMECELEIKEEEYQNRKSLKFRYTPPGQSFGGGGGYKKSPEELDQIMRQNALSHATKLICENPNVVIAAKGKERETLFIVSEEIFQWIKTGKRPAPAPKPAN